MHQLQRAAEERCVEAAVKGAAFSVGAARVVGGFFKVRGPSLQEACMGHVLQDSTLVERGGGVGGGAGSMCAS